MIPNTYIVHRSLLTLDSKPRT